MTGSRRLRALWSLGLLTCCAALGPGATAEERVVHFNLDREQDVLAARLRELPTPVRLNLLRLGRADGVDFGLLLDSRADKTTALARLAYEETFRVIERELKPILVGQDGLGDVFSDRTLPAAALPTGALAELLRKRADSVGRIEHQGGGQLVGTGFVVGDGLVATNCHVLQQMQASGADARFVVDFGGLGAHSTEREYHIEGMAAHPSTRFLDVALLRVASRSLAGDHGLPAAIPLRRARPAPWPEAPLQIVVIGYPNLANLDGADDVTQDVFRRLRERGGGVAKILSPGEVVGLDTQGTIDFLDHIASTLEGQSGSPVLERSTGEALGVHFCCAQPGAPEELNALECSSQRLSDRRNNEAVSAWSAASDTALLPLLSSGFGSGRSAGSQARAARVSDGLVTQRRRQP